MAGFKRTLRSVTILLASPFLLLAFLAGAIAIVFLLTVSSCEERYYGGKK